MCWWYHIGNTPALFRPPTEESCEIWDQLALVLSHTQVFHVFLSVYCFYTVWFSMVLCHNLLRPRGTFYSSFWHFFIDTNSNWVQISWGFFPWIYQVLLPTYLIYSSPRNYAGRAEVRTWMIPPANDLVALPSFLVICNRKFFEPAKEGQRPHRSRDYLTTKAKSFACLPTYHRGPPSNSRSKFGNASPVVIFVADLRRVLVWRWIDFKTWRCWKRSDGAWVGDSGWSKQGNADILWTLLGPPRLNWGASHNEVTLG